tara:strand:+ start:95 stop:784 length:690 start_codon:yes stop_codon:yes gene_type:complete
MRCVILILLLFNISCYNNHEDSFQLQIGDLLFQDLDSSPLCDAIELVTPGHKNANLSHIGIVVEVGNPYCTNNPDYNCEDHIRILEAIPNKVKTTRLDSFLYSSVDKNNNPKVIVGRLKSEYKNTIEDAISFLTSKKGKKYDNKFLMNNDSYYCSELIYEAFKRDSIFEIKPMNFLDPINNKPLKIWQDYYASLEIPIPQGEPGLNPGNMSLSKKIDIIHYYGMPSGMK